MVLVELDGSITELFTDDGRNAKSENRGEARHSVNWFVIRAPVLMVPFGRMLRLKLSDFIAGSNRNKDRIILIHG